MIEVRPTIEVLKDPEKKKLLPLDTVRALQHARQTDDNDSLGGSPRLRGS